MQKYLASLNRHTGRYSFLAKKAVAVGEGPGGSQEPRHWMWHGEDPARHRAPRARKRATTNGQQSTADGQ